MSENLLPQENPNRERAIQFNSEVTQVAQDLEGMVKSVFLGGDNSYDSVLLNPNAVIDEKMYYELAGEYLVRTRHIHPFSTFRLEAHLLSNHDLIPVEIKRNFKGSGSNPSITFNMLPYGFSDDHSEVVPALVIKMYGKTCMYVTREELSAGEFKPKPGKSLEDALILEKEEGKIARFEVVRKGKSFIKARPNYLNQLQYETYSQYLKSFKKTSYSLISTSGNRKLFIPKQKEIVRLLNCLLPPTGPSLN